MFAHFIWAVSNSVLLMGERERERSMISEPTPISVSVCVLVQVVFHF